MTTTGISCEICGMQRAPGEIHPRPSRLMRGMTLLVCSKCESEKKESRPIIVLVARKKGLEFVHEYIKHHRYVGDEITAREIAN